MSAKTVTWNRLVERDKVFITGVCNDYGRVLERGLFFNVEDHFPSAPKKNAETNGVAAAGTVFVAVIDGHHAATKNRGVAVRTIAMVTNEDPVRC